MKFAPVVVIGEGLMEKNDGRNSLQEAVSFKYKQRRGESQEETEKPFL
jgi:hypothetical protein